MRNVLRLTVALVATAWLSQLVAQETRGQISGRVEDVTGAVIPGAALVLSNDNTGVEVMTETNGQGAYVITLIEPGSYKLTVEQSGFKTLIRPLTMRTGARIGLDLVLELGDVSQAVTVTSETPLLDAVSADGPVGMVVDNERIENLPLAHGNPTYLLTIAPGANPGTHRNAFKGDQPEGAGGQGAAFRFSGGAWYSMSFTLNGMDNNLAWNLTAAGTEPPAEAVQEFKISHAYDASHGHSSGTSVDVTLKSGANRVHGAVYGYLRNAKLNANSFLNNRAELDKAASKYRRSGFNISGPVYVPGVYDGRNKTFFSYTLDDFYELIFQPFYGTITVPTAAQINGDFSGLLAGGPNYQIYDPNSTTQVGEGVFTRSPFPNNIIPSSRIDPVAQSLARYWPSPNLPGNTIGLLNYQPSTPVPTDLTHSITRIDHNFGERHRILFQHALVDIQQLNGDTYGTLASGQLNDRTRQNAGVDYVQILSPKLLFNAKYSITRLYSSDHQRGHVTGPDGFDISTLGLAPSLIDDLDLSASGLPALRVSDIGVYGGAYARDIGVDVQSAKTSLSWAAGRHDIKLGFDFRVTRNNQFAGDLMPSYTFGTDYTNASNTTSGAEGQGLAAFVLGRPTDGSIQRRDSFAASNRDYSLYFQDNWRVTPRLTLNLGMRYEYTTPVTERFNRSVRGFDFDAASPIEGAAVAAYTQNPIPEVPVSAFQARGGLRYAGVDGQPRGLGGATWAVAPRIGLAYRMGEKTVFRAGYGIFPLPVGLTSNNETFPPRQDGFSQTTPLISSLDNGLNFVGTLQNPFPGGILEPAGSSGGLSTNLGQGVSFFNTDNLKAPYLQRWSATMQRVLPGSTLVEVSYVGTRSIKLIGDPMQRQTLNLNALPLEYLSQLPSRDAETISHLTSNVVNPFEGLVPGTTLNGANINRQQLLKPYPQFTSVVLRQPNDLYSWYHGMEAKMERRLVKGFSYILGYTWSKNMEALQRLNPADPRPFEVISEDDRRHNLNLTTVVELPFGRGKPIGRNITGAAAKLISGWQVSSVWRAIGGYPMSFHSDVFTTSGFSPENLSIPRSDRTLEHWFNTDAGFVRDPAAQPSFHQRTFPFRFSQLRTDGFNFWDFGITKETALAETVMLRFFTQIQNAFNSTNFGAVNTSPASSAFGQVTQENTNPRQIQFGLKLNF